MPPDEYLWFERLVFLNFFMDYWFSSTNNDLLIYFTYFMVAPLGLNKR